MKKLFTLVLLISSVFVLAQDINSLGTCRKPNHVLLKTQSIEHNTKTGNFAFSINASVTDYSRSINLIACGAAKIFSTHKNRFGQCTTYNR